jgi:hypothetical protein
MTWFRWFFSFDVLPFLLIELPQFLFSDSPPQRISFSDK